MARNDMATTAIVNGTHTDGTPLELSISLPFSLGTRVHLHLTILATSIILFVTTAALDSGASGASLGSFVYAMPDARIQINGFAVNLTNNSAAVQPKSANEHIALQSIVLTRLCEPHGQSPCQKDRQAVLRRRNSQFE
jgi:hypothetical protein